jgi:hypothetical protein
MCAPATCGKGDGSRSCDQAGKDENRHSPHPWWRSSSSSTSAGHTPAGRPGWGECTGDNYHLPPSTFCTAGYNLQCSVILKTTVVIYMWHMHLISRDIKQNILLDKDGHCKLGDFGLSKRRIFYGKTRTCVGLHATRILRWLSPSILSDIPLYCVE